MSTKTPSDRRDIKNRRYSDSQIRESFAKLGLADPEVRRFFQMLAQPSVIEENQPVYWTELHAGTNFATIDPRNA